MRFLDTTATSARIEQVKEVAAEAEKASAALGTICQLGDGRFVILEPEDFRCAAKTKKGRRCLNHADPRLSVEFQYADVRALYLCEHVPKVVPLNESDYEILVTQLCLVHQVVAAKYGRVTE